MAAAGIFKDIITIKRPRTTKNAYGEEVVEYDTIWNTRARVVHTGGNRTNENESIFYTSLKTLEVRDYVPVDYYDHISFMNKEWRVLDIEPFEKQQKKHIKIELVND